eukprot:Rhum_TRINITY_DN14299_c23_g1::Rhum_TRINITY_DN14299_c23_g1_i1::g.78452::m.78452
MMATDWEGAASGVPAASGAPSVEKMDQVEFRSRLLRLYQYHKPGAVFVAESIIQRLSEDKEENKRERMILLQRQIDKLGPEPDEGFVPASAPEIKQRSAFDDAAAGASAAAAEGRAAKADKKVDPQAEEKARLAAQMKNLQAQQGQNPALAHQLALQHQQQQLQLQQQ